MGTEDKKYGQQCNPPADDPQIEQAFCNSILESVSDLSKWTLTKRNVSITCESFNIID